MSATLRIDDSQGFTNRSSLLELLMDLVSVSQPMRSAHKRIMKSHQLPIHHFNQKDFVYQKHSLAIEKNKGACAQNVQQICKSFKIDELTKNQNKLYLRVLKIFTSCLHIHFSCTWLNVKTHFELMHDQSLHPIKYICGPSD